VQMRPVGATKCLHRGDGKPRALHELEQRNGKAQPATQHCAITLSTHLYRARRRQASLKRQPGGAGEFTALRANVNYNIAVLAGCACMRRMHIDTERTYKERALGKQCWPGP
jgi:hypothetical protein